MSKLPLFGIKELIKDRRRLTVFVLFLSLSASIWLLISLGHTYNTTIMIPVKYDNLPENKTLLNEVPARIAVNVAGSGYNLIKYDNEFDDDTLAINMDNLNMSTWGEYQRGYLDANSIGKVLQERAGGALSVNRVLSDTISFVFDLKVARTIGVMPITEFEVEPGYIVLDSGRCSPSELEVFGALTLLDTLASLRTERIKLGELNKSISKKVPVDMAILGGDAELEIDSVVIDIEIDQLTEKRMVVAPELINVPDSLQMLLFPKSVELSFQVALSRFSQVRESDFRVLIDYSKAEEGLQILPVDLVGWPPDAHKVRLQPEMVEFVLTERE